MELFRPKSNCSPRLSPHFLTRVGTCHPVGGDTVYCYDFVSADQSVLDGRGAGIRLVYDDIAVDIRFVDNSTNASIDAFNHHLEVLLLFFGDIDRIRVQALEHRIDACTLNPRQGKSVHIRAVEFLQDGILNFHPFPHIEIL